VYTGREYDLVEKQVGNDERVVKNVVENIHGQDHKMYFDNYFSNDKLLQDLKAEKVHACGTVSHIRKDLAKMNDNSVKCGS
jgi:hypothetical protein